MYIKNTESSTLNSFKAVTKVKAPIDKVLKVIIDAPQLDIDKVKSAVTYKVKQIDSTHHIYYFKNKLPWPIRNRDNVSIVEIEKVSDTLIRCNINAIDETIPKEKNTIRVNNLKGYWLLEEKDGYTMVSQELFIDPGGSIPSFIVNSLLHKGPYNTFLALKREVEI
ncbi:START domain-containing protein [Spongiivirga citrea]|uniref:START domain-containing protein n=1 Tax=Spongiivirga citrea TaxID=1481457 RepID=A0A6M0CMH8_9FLAO|nr:START domain-containing protein [Spongiivirga citrea]NER17214.1 hypothetical protein [Spongiivirga citrea]